MSVPLDVIEKRILFIRKHKVMLDRDIAELYGIETRVLVQAVKRNLKRFPGDFMFQLNKDEFSHWRSQFVISNPSAKMGIRRRPYAFTEHGVAMLSSVLTSEKAIAVNIMIIRAFVRLREILTTHKDLSRKITEMEKRYDVQFKAVFDAIRKLMERTHERTKKRIGFIHPSE
jgi:hypothetical protein